MKGPEKSIPPLKKKGLGNVLKKRKIDILSPIFGTFTEASETLDLASTSTSIGPLKRGPTVLLHISIQVHGMKKYI